MGKSFLLFVLTGAVLLGISQCDQERSFDLDQNLAYCAQQADKTLASIPHDSLMPRNIDHQKTEWRYVPIDDWTSGFWAGTLWYLYETTGDERWKTEADKFSQMLTPIVQRPAFDHDLGFQIFTSFGNGYRLTHYAPYQDVALRAADSLAMLFNPKVGTILSWPRMVDEMNWPHNTIIDNMINLELLFWASKNGGGKHLYDVAFKHAETTMKNHFRDDYTSYHVVVYDTITGAKIKGITHQGYSDKSMWARGQAWAIYGFSMTHRETNDKRFLEFAQKVADVFIERLPEDLIPYWDFDVPDILHEPRDASAAAVAASALIELAQFVNREKADQYIRTARKILTTLSSEKYQSRNVNSAFLLHCTGHKPNGTEVDASIIYGDYYYLEALLRLKRLENKAIAATVQP